jgi:hypothetical protein
MALDSAVRGGYWFNTVPVLQVETRQGTRDTVRSAVENVRIDLRSANVRVPQELLHRPDVVTLVQQVRGKGVPERVGTGRLEDACPPYCLLDGLMHVRAVHVVPALCAGAGVCRDLLCGDTNCQAASCAAPRYFVMFEKALLTGVRKRVRLSQGRA